MNFLLLFPFLRGIVKPHVAPLTYFLFAVNLFVFITTYPSFRLADEKLDQYLSDDAYIDTQGSVFAVMIRQHPSEFSPTLRALGDQADHGQKDSRQLLGSLALRNGEFMKRAATYDFGGDEIAVRSWREKFLELKHAQDEHPSYQWGLSQSHQTWLQWFTYQFAHSGFGHFFWNMVFLLFFGIFVEVRLGGSFVILTYLGGGLAGAYVFSLLSGISSSPLVGASAAISGLMGLVTFGFWKEKIKYFYWLLPIRGYYGFALLPSWLVLVVYALPDISGYLAAVPDFGSIAFTAHLGGTAFGLLIALAYHFGWMEKEVDDEPSGSDAGPLEGPEQSRKAS